MFEQIADSVGFCAACRAEEPISLNRRELLAGPDCWPATGLDHRRNPRRRPIAANGEWHFPQGSAFLANSSGSAWGTGITAIARSSIKNLPGDLPGRAIQGNLANSPSGEINTVFAPAKLASSGCQTCCRNVAAACSRFLAAAKTRPPCLDGRVDIGARAQIDPRHRLIAPHDEGRDSPLQDRSLFVSLSPPGVFVFDQVYQGRIDREGLAQIRGGSLLLGPLLGKRRTNFRELHLQVFNLIAQFIQPSLVTCALRSGRHPVGQHRQFAGRRFKLAI